MDKKNTSSGVSRRRLLQAAGAGVAGGAVLYDGPGTIFAGLGTYVDSMAAIKKLVFETQKYTLEEIKMALDANWEGYPHIKRDCLDAPKYGNDDDIGIGIKAIHFREHGIERLVTLPVLDGTIA